jgi:hypothetical protein
VEASYRNRYPKWCFFLSVHSKSREGRAVTYANEELVVAIEEIRRRPTNSTWFIPIKIDDCIIEPRPIGAGETILDLQVCDLTDWLKGLRQLLMTIGVNEPILDLGRPLAPGLPSFVKLNSGYIKYSHLDGLPPLYRGMEFRIRSGWCQRNDDGRILAYIETAAPFSALEEINRELGLSGFYAVSNASEIAEDGSSPTEFVYARAGSCLTESSGIPIGVGL